MDDTLEASIDIEYRQKYRLQTWLKPGTTSSKAIMEIPMQFTEVRTRLCPRQTFNWVDHSNWIRCRSNFEQTVHDFHSEFNIVQSVMSISTATLLQWRYIFGMPCVNCSCMCVLKWFSTGDFIRCERNNYFTQLSRILSEQRGLSVANCVNIIDWSKLATRRLSILL